MERVEARLENVKQFLSDNPDVSKACAARIFKIPCTTLKSSKKSWGEQ